MIGFVYIWTNLQNGKKYIGAHVGEPTDGYLGSGVLFQKAIKKYGIDQFSREIVYVEKTDINGLFIKEAQIILEHDAVADDLYYNLSSLDPKRLALLLTLGYEYKRKFTNEHRQKISNSKRGKKMSIEARANMSNSGKGKIFSEEHRKNLSLAQIGERNHMYGKRHTCEHRAKISKMNSGKNNPFYGKKHTIETLKRISDKAKVNNAGARNPAAKKIKINGIVYSTIKDACNSLNLNYTQIKKIGEIV